MSGPHFNFYNKYTNNLKKIYIFKKKVLMCKRNHYFNNIKNYYSRDQIKIDKNNILFLQYSIYKDTEDEINRKEVGKKLRDILEVKKYIVVNDHTKVTGKEKWINRIQFYCYKEKISDDQIELIQRYLENIKN